MFTNYSALRIETRNRVLYITINGQGSMNAVDAQLHEELARVFRDAQCDPGSDIVVLTASGKAFCAGADMKWLQDLVDRPGTFPQIAVEAKLIINGMLELEKPLICRLNGTAAGLGATLAVLCDIVIADENARIGDPHVKVGLVAADGGSILWPQLIGFARAKEYLLTGDMLTAREAAALGLVNHAVPASELDAKVQEIVGRIQANPRWAVRWTKAAINIPLRDLANRVSDAALAYENLSNMTADRREAMASMLEKRPPRYTGE